MVDGRERKRENPDRSVERSGFFTVVSVSLLYFPITAG